MPRPILRLAAIAPFFGLLVVAPARAQDIAALKPPAFTELSLGAIKPSGWLKNQLQIQADGLGGHLDEFWPDIKDSSWIGGKAEGWERAPYWLDGAIPLAYLLDDAAMKAKVKRYVDYILDHQQPDGWLGPIGDAVSKHKPYDVWPLFVVFKALLQYEQATGDPRVVPAMLRACKKIDEVTTKGPLYSWAHFRGADLIVGLHWLHDKTGDRSVLALADKIDKQSYDWRRHFEDFDKYREKATKFGLDNHGVNNAMGLKFGAVRYRQSGAPEDRDAIDNMLAKLDKYHGQATGIFTCDEHYAGRSPSQGTELCTVAEAMYSLELAEGIAGAARLGDRLEKLAFNAYPATFKKDMCAHQYDQQANQVVVKVSDPRVYTDNGPDSNLYGLEPNFGCCTANMHQGWPKFTSHLWAKSADGGLAAMAYAPSLVETKIDGKAVTVALKTDYPFSDRLEFTVSSKEKVKVPLHLRIPEWADAVRGTFRGGSFTAMINPGMTLFGSGKGSNFSYKQEGPDRGRFLPCVVETEGDSVLTLTISARPRLYQGFNDAVAIERGPLVYALKIGTEWKRLKGTEPFADWEVFPTTPWNYALEIDREHPEKSIVFETKPAGDRPFSQESAPIVAKVKGRKLPGWTLEKNAAAPPPKSPATSDEPLEELTLIPYGCTDLRVTEFPTLRP